MMDLWGWGGWVMGWAVGQENYVVVVCGYKVVSTICSPVPDTYGIEWGGVSCHPICKKEPET